MTNRAAANLGRKGGRNSRINLDPGEAKALAQTAAKARWDAYYKAHPEKLKAKLERTAKGKRAGKRAKKKEGHD